MSDDYSREDIVNALREAGVASGDSIFVHSNIGFFGRLRGARVKDDYYRIFKDAFFKVLGGDGTLVVPTFSYSFCWKQIFDKENTPGITGLLAEMVRRDPESLRSDDANFSIAAIGKNARYFTAETPEFFFGTNGFCERFLRVNGKFCNFNFDSASTFVHYVERELKVSYRYDKAFPGISIENGRQQAGVYYHFVYGTDKPEDSPAFTRFDEAAKSRGIAKTANLGKGQIVLISARDTYDLIKKELRKNPAFLTVAGAG